MKRHSKIIKALGLLVLIFVLASAVAVSENSCEITVTIVESSSSDGGNNSNTVISTYDSETGLTETTKISGSSTEVIAPVDDATSSDGDTTPVDTTPVDTTPVDTTPVDTTPVDTTPTESPDSEGSGANGDLNPDAEPTDLQLDDSTYDDEWVELILSMIDADPFAIFDDFQGLDTIAAFE